MAREAIELRIEGLRARGEYVPTEETPPIVAAVDVSANPRSLSLPVPTFCLRFIGSHAGHDKAAPVRAGESRY